MKLTKTIIPLLLGLFLPLIIYAQMTQGHLVATCYSDCAEDDVIVAMDVNNSEGVAPGLHWGAVPYKHGTNTSIAELGALFGIALDDNGNVYTTASSVYRIQACNNQGGTDSQMASMSHVTHNGMSPTMIYRIEGSSMEDNVDWDIDTEFVVEGGFIEGENTIPNPANDNNQRAALGNIAYSSEHDLLYVTNLSDGLIYSLNTDGELQSSFDPNFDGVVGDPASIGNMAPLGQRPWGIGVLQSVDDPTCYDEGNDVWLYYSRWSRHNGTSNAINNEIWAVELDNDGDFEPDTEVLIASVPSTSQPVSDIEFSSDFKKMLIAEKGMWDDVDDPSAHNARILEFIRLGGSHLEWVPSDINKFEIGVIGPAGNRRNTAGGVDYGANDIFTNYDEDANCDKSIWATGDAIRFGGPGGLVYGVQGFHCQGGTIDNSIAIDLDDNTSNFMKYLVGDVDFYNPNCDEGVEIPEAYSSYSFDDCTTVSFDGPHGMDDYEWDFGTGDTDDDKNVTYQFPGPGAYTVTLTVTEDGESDINTLIVFIDPGCVDPICEESFSSTMQSLECNISDIDEDTGIGTISYDFDVHIWDEDDEFQDAQITSTYGTITNVVIDYKNHNVVSINGNFTPSDPDSDMFCVEITSVSDLCEGEENCPVQVCAPLPDCECSYCDCLISNVVTHWPENITPGEEFCFLLEFDYTGIMEGTELRFYTELDDDYDDDGDVEYTNITQIQPNTDNTVGYGHNVFELCMVYEGDCVGDIHLLYDVIFCGMECKIWEMHQIPCGECTNESDKPQPLISYYYLSNNTVQFKGYPGFDEYEWDFGNLDDYDDDEHPEYTYYQYGTYNASLWVEGDDSDETYLDYIEVVIEEDCTPQECNDFFDANMHSVDCATDEEGNILYDFEIHVWNPDDEAEIASIISDLGTITNVETDDDINNVLTIKGRFHPTDPLSQLCLEVIWTNASYCSLDMCSTIPDCECQECLLSNVEVVWPSYITPEVEFCVDLFFDYLGEEGLPIDYYVDLDNSSGDIELTQVIDLTAPFDGNTSNGPNEFRLCFIYHGECKGDIALFFDGIIDGVDCKIWEMHDIPCVDRVKPCDPKEIGAVLNIDYEIDGDNITLSNASSIPAGWAVVGVSWFVYNDIGIQDVLATGDGATISSEFAKKGICMQLLIVNDKKETCLLEYCERFRDDEKRLLSRDVTLYPNPVQDQLHIDTGKLDGKIESIILTNIQGKNLGNINVTNSPLYTYSTSNLPDGMYFITITSDDAEPITLKFIKN